MYALPCPKCNRNLRPVYSPKDPSSIEKYTCPPCGITYPPDITEIYVRNVESRRHTVKFSLIIKRLLERRSNLETPTSISDAVEKELEKKYGIILDSKNK